MAGGVIVGGLEYATALASELTTIDRYLGYFRALLEGMVAGDAQRVDRLAHAVRISGAAEGSASEWNETKAEYPKEKCRCTLRVV